MSRRDPIRPSTPVARWSAALVLLVAALAVALDAAAQGPFQITFKTEPTGADQTRVSGSVFNTSLREVLDVYVTAEALDERGKVVARGVTFVAPVIQPRELVGFSASVPAGTKAQRFNIYVSSFNYGLRARPESP